MKSLEFALKGEYLCYFRGNRSIFSCRLSKSFVSIEYWTRQTAEARQRIRGEQSSKHPLHKWITIVQGKFDGYILEFKLHNYRFYCLFYYIFNQLLQQLFYLFPIRVYNSNLHRNTILLLTVKSLQPV